ncbi:MAG: DUF4235 domain-containing protein [Gemmatimonadota bacterium]|nr:DUF4235 domain-containing protein [Gemmatimonadota bacterium]
MSDSIEEHAWEALAAGSAVIAAVAMRNAAKGIWRRTRGEEPPDDPTADDVDWIDVIAWSAALGVAVGLSRLLARRSATATWRMVTGDEPPEERTA